MRILVRATNWIGDAVLSLPALRDLRRRNFPDARIEVLARGWVSDLYRMVAEIDGVVESRGLAEDVARLRSSYDVAVLLPNSFRSALEAFASGIPERWGYALDGRKMLLTRHCPVPRAIRGRSQVYYYRAMLSGVGLQVSAQPDAKLTCPEAWAERGKAILGEGEFLAMSPGAFYGSAKRWIPARYAAAGDLLSRRFGKPVVILGGAAERSLGEAIASSMRTKARVLCGETSLPDLVGVFSKVSLLLTNDSGPMHVASALGVPVVAVFGPTDWRETHPVGRHALVRSGVECAPCLLRDCPIDHRCMTRVGVADVVEAARGLWGGAA